MCGRPVTRGDAPLPIRFGPACRLPPIWDWGWPRTDGPCRLRPSRDCRRCGLDHLRVDLALERDASDDARCAAAAEQARQLGTALHVAVALDDRSEHLLSRSGG